MDEIMIPNAPAVPSFADELQSQGVMFCSMEAKTAKDKARLFKAMNSPEHRIAECVNMTINIKDVFCETVNCVRKETGEVDIVPRVVLIDDKGEGYQAVSMGIFGSLKKLIQVFGLPTWDDPIPVVVKQINKDKNKILTLDIKV